MEDRCPLWAQPQHRQWVLEGQRDSRACVPPAENCFMHQAQEKVSLNDRLEKACEPGVDYGECGF